MLWCCFGMWQSSCHFDEILSTMQTLLGILEKIQLKSHCIYSEISFISFMSPRIKHVFGHRLTGAFLDVPTHPSADYSKQFHAWFHTVKNTHASVVCLFVFVFSTNIIFRKKNIYTCYLQQSTLVTLDSQPDARSSPTFVTKSTVGGRQHVAVCGVKGRMMAAGLPIDLRLKTTGLGQGTSLRRWQIKSDHQKHQHTQHCSCLCFLDFMFDPYINWLVLELSALAMVRSGKLYIRQPPLDTTMLFEVD